jgi:hypothetical protein
MWTIGSVAGRRITSRPDISTAMEYALIRPPRPDSVSSTTWLRNRCLRSVAAKRRCSRRGRAGRDTPQPREHIPAPRMLPAEPPHLVCSGQATLCRFFLCKLHGRPRNLHIPARSISSLRLVWRNQWARAMAPESGSTSKREAYSAAFRRFPHFELAIRRLMGRSEAFRDMCDELAEAEMALLKVDKVSPALREARRAEWQELIDRLVKEVEAALQDKDVVVKPRAGR